MVGQKVKVISTAFDRAYHDRHFKLAPLTIRMATEEECKRYGIGKMERTCTKCGETKPIRFFGKRKDSKDGISRVCKECVNKKFMEIRRREKKEQDNEIKRT